LAGIDAADEADGLAAGVALGLLFAVGDEDLVGEAEVAGFGVGDTVFSVVTDTVGSLLFSGDAAGEAASSWAIANGAAAAQIRVRARTVIFIRFSFLEFRGGNSETRRRALSI
jgi:hypothetical protein